MVEPVLRDVNGDVDISVLFDNIFVFDALGLLLVSVNIDLPLLLLFYYYFDFKILRVYNNNRNIYQLHVFTKCHESTDNALVKKS